MARPSEPVFKGSLLELEAWLTTQNTADLVLQDVVVLPAGEGTDYDLFVLMVADLHRAVYGTSPRNASQGLWELLIHKVHRHFAKQQPQRQDSLSEQLADLHRLAARYGMYDAADWLWKHVPSETAATPTEEDDDD